MIKTKRTITDVFSPSSPIPPMHARKLVLVFFSYQNNALIHVMNMTYLIPQLPVLATIVRLQVVACVVGLGYSTFWKKASASVVMLPQVVFGIFSGASMCIYKRIKYSINSTNVPYGNPNVLDSAETF